MTQSITEQIIEGMELWEKKIGLKPNVCYLGKFEMEQWLAANDEDLKVLDIIVHSVTDCSYMGFGI